MLLATYKKDKSRFDDVVKALVENKRGGNDYKSVLEILNIYQAVGDMHFIEERDYFKKIVEKLEKKLGTHQKGGHHAQTYPTLQLPQKLPARAPCQLHQLHRHP